MHQLASESQSEHHLGWNICPPRRLGQELLQDAPRHAQTVLAEICALVQLCPDTYNQYGSNSWLCTSTQST